MLPGTTWTWTPCATRAIEEAAVLLNAEEDQIALVESTTHGLNIAANAIPLRPGDRVLIADTEYLQVSIPWKMKEASVGVELVPVPTGPERHCLRRISSRTPWTTEPGSCVSPPYSGAPDTGST